MATFLNMTTALTLFLLAASGIFVGCLVPARYLPPLRHDKWMHFAAFLVLAMLAGRITQSIPSLLAWWCGLFFAGAAIEVIQHWVPGRQFCWRDLAANTGGILLAAVSTIYFSDLV